MARPAIRYASVPTAKPVRPLGGKILTLAVFAASLALFILAWLALRGLGPQPEAATAKPNGTPPPDVPPVKLASGNQAPTQPPKSPIAATNLTPADATPEAPGKPARPTSPLVAGQLDAAPSAAPSANGRSPLAMASKIDFAIEKKLQELGVPPSPIASDAEFLRRVSLDLTGKIPSAERTAAFLASTDPARRSKLIEELLASEDFGRNFAHYWRDLLAKREGEYQYVPNEPVFLRWMARQYNQNLGWDKIVRALLTARGEEAQHGEAYLFLTSLDMQQPAPDKLAATITTLFMGTQLQCAQCHVHPVYKEWGQRDFWGIAAYFAHTRADRPGGGKKGNGPATITDVGSPVGGGKDGAKKGKAIAANLPGTVKIPDPTEPKRIVGTARAKVFGGKEAGTLPKDAYRGALADWFTSPENSYFARAHVNRMWAYFFATGFVNPIDDLRPDNPVSHPELFKELAHEFEASGFDVKHLMRCVCNSKAYQRTSRKMPGSEDGPFSRMPVRVLTPHQLFDSLATATGREVTGVSPAGKAKGKKDGPKPTGDEAVIQAFDTRDYDENPAEYTYGIPQLLRLMNRQLTAACDDMGKQLASRSEEEAIETLYLRALSRRPTPREMIRMREFIVAAGNRTRGYSGVFWALLNSAEFICNR